MAPEEALMTLNLLLPKQKLKDLKEDIFRYSWKG
jgi:hypothetical protein